LFHVYMDEQILDSLSIIFTFNEPSTRAEASFSLSCPQ